MMYDIVRFLFWLALAIFFFAAATHGKANELGSRATNDGFSHNKWKINRPLAVQTDRWHSL